MTKPRYRLRADGSIVPVPAPAAPYEVGYGKPPVATRFKKGQSGNPRGRANAASPPAPVTPQAKAKPGPRDSRTIDAGRELATMIGRSGMWHASAGSRFGEAFVGEQAAYVIRQLVRIAERGQA